MRAKLILVTILAQIAALGLFVTYRKVTGVNAGVIVHDAADVVWVSGSATDGYARMTNTNSWTDWITNEVTIKSLADYGPLILTLTNRNYLRFYEGSVLMPLTDREWSIITNDGAFSGYLVTNDFHIYGQP